MLAFAMRVSAPGSNNALSESQGQRDSISSRLMARTDVGVYLEFAKGKKNYDNFFAIYELLQGLFGRPIDLVTDGSLSERKARIILPTVRYASLNA
jgi:predicted nucleotidyltransferase